MTKMLYAALTKAGESGLQTETEPERFSARTLAMSSEGCRAVLRDSLHK